ncbi:E3 ubiquitin-protein ligase CHIP [Sarcoptes scabiei]|nr:E3 ubiquitin-protein ligase CHIP [Sarcoptes scabiei]
MNKAEEDCSIGVKKEMTALELKNEGNKYFTLHKYEDALQFYSQAIDRNPTIATLFTNRALCHLKMKNWEFACDDCRKSLDLDQNLIKGHFFLGLSLLELGHYDESILHLQRKLAKESKMNYGDEITYKIRLARKKRWNAMEEKRISEEIELQTYLSNLIKMDKENRFKTLWIDVENKKITDEQTIKNLEQNINSSYEQRMIAMNDLFQQVNEKRQKREVPDYLCGKISFDIMHDPVITPSGITYDRKDIDEHLQRVGHFDPVTRNPLTANQLIPNLAMKEVIDNFLIENEWANDY